jgi:hypothetical protein
MVFSIVESAPFEGAGCGYRTMNQRIGTPVLSGAIELAEAWRVPTGIDQIIEALIRLGRETHEHEPFKSELGRNIAGRPAHGIGSGQCIQIGNEVEGCASKALGRFSHHRSPQSLQSDLLLKDAADRVAPTGLASRLEQAVAQSNRHGLSAGGGTELAHRRLRMLVTVRLATLRISPISQADLPLADQASTSRSRSVSGGSACGLIATSSRIRLKA